MRAKLRSGDRGEEIGEQGKRRAGEQESRRRGEQESSLDDRSEIDLLHANRPPQVQRFAVRKSIPSTKSILSKKRSAERSERRARDVACARSTSVQIAASDLVAGA